MWMGYVGQRTDLDRRWSKSVLGQWDVDYNADVASSGAMPAEAGFDWSGVGTMVGDLAKVYLSVEQMRFIQEENQRRLAAGQPLLSQTEIAAIQPQAGVSVGVAPQTQTMLYVAIAVIAAVILLPALMKKR